MGGRKKRRCTRRSREAISKKPALSCGNRNGFFAGVLILHGTNSISLSRYNIMYPNTFFYQHKSNNAFDDLHHLAHKIQGHNGDGGIPA